VGRFLLPTNLRRVAKFEEIDAETAEKECLEKKRKKLDPSLTGLILFMDTLEP